MDGHSEMLQLCAAADEAANGVGIPSGDGAAGNEFEWRANEMLLFNSTLCQHVHASRVRVAEAPHTSEWTYDSVVVAPSRIHCRRRNPARLVHVLP